MRCKKIIATESLTSTNAKGNEVPMIKGICTFYGCKNFFKQEAMIKTPG